MAPWYTTHFLSRSHSLFLEHLAFIRQDNSRKCYVITLQKVIHLWNALMLLTYERISFQIADTTRALHSPWVIACYILSQYLHGITTEATFGLYQPVSVLVAMTSELFLTISGMLKLRMAVACNVAYNCIVWISVQYTWRDCKLRCTFTWHT